MDAIQLIRTCFLAAAAGVRELPSHLCACTAHAHSLTLGSRFQCHPLLERCLSALWRKDSLLSRGRGESYLPQSCTASSGRSRPCAKARRWRRAVPSPAGLLSALLRSFRHLVVALGLPDFDQRMASLRVRKECRARPRCSLNVIQSSLVDVGIDACPRCPKILGRDQSQQEQVGLQYAFITLPSWIPPLRWRWYRSMD